MADVRETFMALDGEPPEGFIFSEVYRGLKHLIELDDVELERIRQKSLRTTISICHYEVSPASERTVDVPWRFCKRCLRRLRGRVTTRSRKS